VSYTGRHAVVWRYDRGDLVAFAGRATTGIELNGTRFAWSETPADVAWHPLGAAYAAEVQEVGVPIYRVWVGSTGTVTLPLPLPEGDLQVWRGSYAHGNTASSDPVHMPVGYVADQVLFEVVPEGLRLTIDDRSVGHWLYVME
jgi:hypothetical protein